MRIIVFLSLILLFFGGCDSAASKKQSSVPQYFSLKNFIDQEAKRLQQLNPEISKTVTVNSSEENKQVKIADWQKELSAFSDADINKSSWQGLFQLHKTKDQEIYLSNNDKVPVKSLNVTYRSGKVSKLQIINNTTNILYSSNDTLSYIPDSLYEIKKTQHIKLLNEKNYRILGRF